MAEFDEKKYKHDHGYDALYDAYLKIVKDNVKNDPNKYIPAEYKKGGLSIIVSDLRNINNYAQVKWPKGSTPAEADQQTLDQIISNVSNYAALSFKESDELQVFWAELQDEKNKAVNFQGTDGSGVKMEGSTTANMTKTSFDKQPVVPPPGVPQPTKVNEVRQRFDGYYKSWDPRLQRLDTFYMKNQDDFSAVKVPFASNTAASAFADKTWLLERDVAQGLAKKGKIDELRISEELTKENSIYSKLDPTDRIMMNAVNELSQFDDGYGVQSIIHPFSLTKLMGGVMMEGSESSLTPINYMYDIRDRRRFYAMSTNDPNKRSDNDVLSISNPSVTQLIQWSNADAWGRTPYSFQDFVFCKYFGLIPNNRLITLRRYPAPTYDNLQFPNMFGPHESDEGTSNNVVEAQGNVANKTFAPYATVVTWFGGDTGNQLSTLMNFTTGINWTDLKADIHTVNGETGESKQAVIDKLLGNGDHKGLYSGAELDWVNSLMEGGSMLSGRITSFGKFLLGVKGTILPIDQQSFEKLASANLDPYDAQFQNRIKGPVNRIDKVKKREAGIQFEQALTIKCSYRAKSIGGINPKAAILDVLGNCLEMVSPHAVFWGGGYRFMVNPSIYPFHDGGWRDSFMERVYDGKFLGDDGAINVILSGIKKVGTNENGEFSLDAIKASLGSIGGDTMAMIGAAISSVSNIFGGSDLLSSIGDAANGLGSVMSGENAADLKATGATSLGNLFNNLQNLWHSRMAAETMQPKIQSMGNLLVGEPVGEWHLTVGNPLNPIMVIGNLVCSKMVVDWDDELGPDDFPMGFDVTYTLEHGMPRDNDAIQSMFNRGMGKYYVLPDRIVTSSERITHVDKYTADGGTGDTGHISYKDNNARSIYENDDDIKMAYQEYQISGGSPATNSGSWNTQLITKFTPLNALPSRTLSINDIRTRGKGQSTIANIRSLAATRKFNNE